MNDISLCPFSLQCDLLLLLWRNRIHFPIIWMWLPGSIECDQVIVCDLLPRLTLMMPYNFCFDLLRTLSSSYKVAWFIVIKDERPCGEAQPKFNTNNRKWEWGHIGAIGPYWSTSYPKRWMSPSNTRGAGGLPIWDHLYDFVVYNETDS